MDTRLEELTNRAKRATELAAQLKELGSATLNGFSTLNWDLKSDVFEAGRKAIVDKKTAELESLLGGNDVQTTGNLTTEAQPEDQ